MNKIFLVFISMLQSEKTKLSKDHMDLGYWMSELLSTKEHWTTFASFNVFAWLECTSISESKPII